MPPAAGKTPALQASPLPGFGGRWAGARPFVKWAGGKGQLLGPLEGFWPPGCQERRYIEPFLGGGAVYFHLAPAQALLGDANPDLLETWQVVRDQVEALIESLERHLWDETYYYQLRAVDPAGLTPVDRASRFIYLNKTCYNGLYRVNRRGQFNVPFGRYKTKPQIYDADNLRAASALLRSAELRLADFDATMAKAGAGDFVYLDPPYDPVSATANFTGYTVQPLSLQLPLGATAEDGEPAGALGSVRAVGSARFGRAEQERLAAAVRAATGRGAYVLLNNSDTPFIRSLFPPTKRRMGQGLLPAGEYRVAAVETNRAINSDPSKRKGALELVVTNYL